MWPRAGHLTRHRFPGGKMRPPSDRIEGGPFCPCGRVAQQHAESIRDESHDLREDTGGAAARASGSHLDVGAAGPVRRTVTSGDHPPRGDDRGSLASLPDLALHGRSPHAPLHCGAAGTGLEGSRTVPISTGAAAKAHPLAFADHGAPLGARYGLEPRRKVLRGPAVRGPRPAA